MSSSPPPPVVRWKSLPDFTVPTSAPAPIVSLANSYRCERGVLVRANVDNIAVVRLLSEGVTEGGYRLLPNQEVFLPVRNPIDVFAVSDVAGQILQPLVF